MSKKHKSRKLKGSRLIIIEDGKNGSTEKQDNSTKEEVFIFYLKYSFQVTIFLKIQIFDIQYLIISFSFESMVIASFNPLEIGIIMIHILYIYDPHFTNISSRFYLHFTTHAFITRIIWSKLIITMAIIRHMFTVMIANITQNTNHQDAIKI